MHTRMPNFFIVPEPIITHLGEDLEQNTVAPRGKYTTCRRRGHYVYLTSLTSKNFQKYATPKKNE